MCAIQVYFSERPQSAEPQTAEFDNRSEQERKKWIQERIGECPIVEHRTLNALHFILLRWV